MSSKRGPCGNCGREQSQPAMGLCYACYRAGFGLVGEERAAALAEVKRRIDTGAVHRGGFRSGKRMARPPVPPAAKIPAAVTVALAPASVTPAPGRLPYATALSVEKVAAARLPEGTPVISLEFLDERDRTLHEAVLDHARRFRRTPEQQILWMIQNQIEFEADLLAEAGQGTPAVTTRIVIAGPGETAGGEGARP